MKRFDEKTVLITGAGSGIGRETAYAFAKRGAHILVVDINERGGRQTVNEISSRYPNASARFMVCDMSSRDSVEALAHTVHQYHTHVDVLINNAGIGAAGRFLNTRLETWDKVIDVNLKGVIYGCHYFLPAMIKSGLPCHVVNVASAAAFYAPQEMPVYGTSKSAVLGFTEILRQDMADYKIGVSAVCPGLIDTPIVANTLVEADKSNAEQFLKRAVTLYKKRAYPPSKVARAIVKAVETNAGVKPVSPEAWFMYYTKRWAPAVWPIIGKLNKGQL